MAVLARTCGWCGTSALDAALSHCASCGGPLPVPRYEEQAAILLGPAPPPAPRQLPGAFVRDVLVFKNINVVIGGLFVFVFFWTVIFPLIGAPLLYLGWTRAQRRLRALRLGLPVEGRIRGIDRDGSIRLNGRSPWRVDYEYPGPHGPVEAWVHAWRSPGLREGDPCWIVVLPEEPEHGCLWPPLK